MASALHPAIQRQLVGGNDVLTDIKRVSAYLAELMKEVHGDDWSVAIDHEACFVVVARNFADPRKGER